MPGSPLQIAPGPEGVWSPPPEWRVPPGGDAAAFDAAPAAVWTNHWLGEPQLVAVGSGGRIWFRPLNLWSATPVVRIALPSGADLHGVSFDLVDGFVVGDLGTIMHIAVDGFRFPIICEQ